MNRDCSIVTIVKKRVRQLSNLVRSIELMNDYPAELVVVWMAPPCSESLLTSDYFDIHHKFIANEFLPIAKARNKGFSACSASNILYLDVDCICPPDLIASVMNVLTHQRVLTSRIKYLCDTPEHVDYQALERNALPDPVDADIPTEAPVSFTHFKSMIFAIRRKDYERTGGFDENFSGYGVGDIDFATRCEEAGMTLQILATPILHQYHPRVDPPVNHLSDIVSNATRFKQKWGYYPLQDYLEKFAEEGLINADYRISGLRVKRLPTDEEIHAHLSTKPY